MENTPFTTSDLASLNGEIMLAIGACVVLVWGAFAVRGKPTGHRFAWVTLLFVLAALAGVMLPWALLRWQ